MKAQDIYQIPFLVGDTNDHRGMSPEVLAAKLFDVLAYCQQMLKTCIPREGGF